MQLERDWDIVLAMIDPWVKALATRPNHLRTNPRTHPSKLFANLYTQRTKK